MFCNRMPRTYRSGAQEAYDECGANGHGAIAVRGQSRHRDDPSPDPQDSVSEGATFTVAGHPDLRWTRSS
jgi:hypothetical protein